MPSFNAFLVDAGNLNCLTQITVPMMFHRCSNDDVPMIDVPVLQDSDNYFAEKVRSHSSASETPYHRT